MSSVEEYAAVKVMFQSGISATLSIKLTKAMVYPATIYGMIKADFGGVDQYTIYNTRRSEAQPVNKDDEIPLKLQELSVPTAAGILYIRPNLYSKGQDGEIADSVVYFPVSYFGIMTKNSVGKNGEIEVTVTWNNNASN